MIFKKGDHIFHKDNKGVSCLKCIIADRQLAVFGKVSKIKGGFKTSFMHTKIVGNTKRTLSDNFKYSLVKNN